MLGKRAERDKPTQTSDVTKNFDALSKWCEQSVTEVSKATQANPIKGDELKKRKLEHIRAELNAKTVRWRLKVNGIDPAGAVSVRSYHTVPHEMIDERGRRVPYENLILSVAFQDKEDFRGTDMAFNPIYRIKGIPQQKLRDLVIGEFADVVGMVTDVKIDSSIYTVEVKNATIE